MKVCRYSPSSLQNLRKEWDNFHYKCVNEINSQLNDDIRTAQREAEDDLRYERYDEYSINNWLRDRESELRSDANDFRNTIDREYEAGKELISKLGQLAFKDTDNVDIEIYFVSGELKGLRKSSGGVNTRSHGVVREIGDVKLEFHPSKIIEYTPWQEMQPTKEGSR